MPSAKQRTAARRNIQEAGEGITSSLTVAVFLTLCILLTSQNAGNIRAKRESVGANDAKLRSSPQSAIRSDQLQLPGLRRAAPSTLPGPDSCTRATTRMFFGSVPGLSFS